MNINKKFILPKKCMRKRNDCTPLSLVKATDNSYMCCGLNFTRNVEIDLYRHCFKTEATDSMYDYSKKDMLSVIAVFSESMNIVEQDGKV